MARIIDLTQGSQDWLKWRTGGLGGSDANLIAFHFLPDDIDWPFGGWSGGEIYKLWGQKVGRIPVKQKQDKSFGDYVDPLAHGLKTEQEAREWYNATYGELCEPVCLQHDILPHLRASLDGWPEGDGNGRPILEIKCPKEPGMHRKAKEGEIPRYYWGQLVHNMCVASATTAHFVSYYKGEGVMIPVEMDPVSLDKLREAEEIFWGWVEARKFGGLPVSGETNNVSAEWEGACLAYFTNQKAMRDLEARERRLKRELHSMMKASTVVGGGARVSIAVRPAYEVKASTRNEFLLLSIQEE